MIFLGGTCGNNNWRESFTEDLIQAGVPAESIFNPVVSDWNEDVQKAEEHAKATASFLLFYLADPKQDGNPLSTYSVVEAMIGLYEEPARTIVVFDHDGLAGHALKVALQIEKHLRNRFVGSIFPRDLAVDCVARLLAPVAQVAGQAQ